MHFKEFVNKSKNVLSSSSARRITASIPITEQRDAFFNGELFKKYDTVTSEDKVYRILEQCSNYYQVVDEAGNVSRKFAKQLTKVEPTELFITESNFHGYQLQSDSAIKLFNTKYDVTSNNNDDVGLLKQLKEADKMDTTIKTKDKLVVAKIIADAIGVPHDSISTPENLVNAAIRKAKKDPALMKNKAILQNMLQIAKDVGIKFNDDVFAVTEAVINEKDTEHWSPTGKEGTHIKTGEKTKEFAHHKNGVATGKRQWKTEDGKVISEAEAPLKHHSVMVSYHKKSDPHRRFEARFKTTHNSDKKETEKRAHAAFAEKGRVVYSMVHEDVNESTHKPVPNCDEILLYLTKAYRSITHGVDNGIDAAGKQMITHMYSSWRSYLMEDDFEGFDRSYDKWSMDHPDAFDFFVDAVFEAAGLGMHGTHAQFMKKVSESVELEELSVGKLKSYSDLSREHAKKLVASGIKAKTPEVASQKLSKASKRMEGAAKADKKSFAQDWKQRTGQ
jgi:hypothetical protein